MAYFAIESAYILYADLSLDDFWLGFHNYEYKTALPYRDFPPYKTVLGYYIFLIPLSLFHGPLKPLIFTKLVIALINTGFLAIIALWLKKFYEPKAIFTSFALIIFMQMFLCFSADLRVDVLAFWFCLVSLLLIFEEKFILAGLCLGFAFLISQKAIWYFVATNCGLFTNWLCEERSWKAIKKAVFFNSSAIILLLIYIFFWAYFANLSEVLNSVFYEAWLISSQNWSMEFRDLFWRFIVNNNPGLILLWPIAFMGLFILPVKRRPFLLSYSLTILVFVIHVKQPFAYYLLAALPVLFLVYCEFFSAVYRGFFLSTWQKKWVVIFSILYLIGLGFLSLKLHLATAYLIVALIPSLLAIYFMEDLDENWRIIFTKLLAFTFVLIGIIFPVFLFIYLVPSLDGRYQRSMIYLTDELLKEGGSYVAGVPLLHSVKQPVPGLVHLIGPSLVYLKQPSKELYPAMQLGSLYLSPDSSQQIIESIKKAPVKLYVDNNRFHSLPPEIHQFLASQYQHFWGSIFLYAPLVTAGRQTLTIKFSGQYKVLAAKEALIYLDKRRIMPNSISYLEKQSYLSDANSSYRLKLIPAKLNKPLEPEFKSNQWQRVLNWY